MKNDAPQAIITSVVPYWGPLYIRLIESIIDGTFSPLPHFYGLTEGVIDITPLDIRLAPPGAEEAVYMARRRILQEAYNVFDGVLESNDGRSFGEDGTTLSDDIILSGMDWYYRTVIEL